MAKKRRKTRRQKILLQLKRQQERKRRKKMALKKDEKFYPKTDSPFFFEWSSIKKDLVKTLILTIIVISLEFMLYLRLKGEGF